MAFNLNSLCRLCMGIKTPLVSLYDKEKLLVEKITAISTSLRIEPGDGLPAQVCLECAAKLDMSYNFKLQCERADASYRQILKGGHQQYVVLLLKPLTAPVKQDAAAIQYDINESKEETIPRSENHDHDDDDDDDKGSSSSDHEDSALEPSLLLEVDIKEEPLDISEENENDGKLRWDEEAPDMQAASLQQFHCKNCNDVFSTFQQLNQHLKTYSDGSCSLKCFECGKMFSTQDNLNIHLKSHTGERPYSCQDCNKTFRLRNHLEAHIIRHSNNHCFPCSMCSLRFKSPNLLSLHINRMHIARSLYVCMECGHKFTVQKAYDRHISQRVCRDRFCKCTYCGKLFKCQTSLNIHKRVHTGEKPYICTLCSRAFSQNSSLKVHMRIHTGEKPFECDVCLARFSLKCTLKKHIITSHINTTGKEDVPD